MQLFILESLGTQELILIGIVALIFLGPRKLPEYARKIGKIMADLKKTSNEFRQTWEHEVDFEEEEKALRLDAIEAEAETEKTIARKKDSELRDDQLASPEVREIDKEAFERISAKAANNAAEGTDEQPEATEKDLNGSEPADEPDLLSDKRNWL